MEKKYTFKESFLEKIVCGYDPSSHLPRHSKDEGDETPYFLCCDSRPCQLKVYKNKKPYCIFYSEINNDENYNITYDIK